MRRLKKFEVEKYVVYNEEYDISKCLVCSKKLKGNKSYNIKRHYETMHGVSFPNNYNFEKEASLLSSSQSPSSSVFACKTVNTNNFTISMEKNEFLSSCLGLVTETDLPFRIFDDDKYFKKLLQPYEEYFHTNLNSDNIIDEVNSEAIRIRQNILNAVDKKLICLKIDAASRKDKRILTLNIQYMVESKIFSYTIGMIQLKPQHIAKSLKEKIIEYLQEFSIDISKVYSCTFDATDVNITANLLKELQDEMQGQFSPEDQNSDNEEFLDVKDPSPFGLTCARCPGLTIQLIAQDVITTLEPQIDECRTFITKLRQIIRKENDPYLKIPTHDNNTNKAWKSTVYMLNSLFELKEYVENMTEADLPKVDWNFVKRIGKAFKPLVEYMDKLKCEPYIIGDFYRDWLNCEVELEELVEEANAYAKLLLEAMNIQKQNLLNNKTFIAALYLDPRFNFLGTPFLTQEQLNTALLHLLHTYKFITRWSGSLETYTVKLFNISTGGEFSKLEDKINKLIDLKPILPAESIKQRLLNLCNAERLLFNTNILEHWSHMKNIDPELAQLVDVALALPTTQLSLKKTFSALAIVLKLNGRFNEQEINNVLLLN